ncbi:MAG: phosphoglucosamine mutase [Deltaproteobacteria bacterium]|nr:phosphoglucosamine mutase [Deltaproteobacteria bacterium]
MSQSTPTTGSGRTRQLFGTDGVRGIANAEPMTSETALRLGRAVAHVFRRTARPGHRSRVVIGKDTRVSGYMLETAMASGICSMGVDVLLVGPMPTPGIAFLTRSLRADAGAVISASHNPFQDNGIKFFSSEGYKLPDEVELEIERLVLDNGIDHLRPTAEHIGKAYRIDDALGRYNVFVKSTFPREFTLDGLRVVVDAANGAAYRIAPEVLAELGATVSCIGCDPDGENINRDCGATAPEALQRAVIEQRAHVGVALDGDGDRCLLVDECGEIVDGDAVLAIAARELAERGRLQHRTLVTTHMSNFGLELAMRELGIRLVKTAVGDRYVLEEMQRGGYNLGGEQSGHVLFLDHTTTGDGLISALAILAVMRARNQPLSALARVMQKFPQVLINIPVREKRDLAEVVSVRTVVAQVEQALAGRGRVYIRFSGTEALARVMVEGQDLAQVERHASDIADAVRAALGAGASAPEKPGPAGDEPAHGRA